MKTKVKDGRSYVLVWAPLDDFYGRDKKHPSPRDPLDTINWEFA